MKTMFTLFVSTVLFFSASIQTTAQSGSAAKADAILGEWMNAEKDASFLIFKKNSNYFGKVTWGTGDDSKDSKNPDPKLRQRDLIGLVILTDFEFKGDNVWHNGRIYDPKDGKTYDCKLTLKNSNTLEVRGYVGFTMFGRTDIWTRK